MKNISLITFIEIALKHIFLIILAGLVVGTATFSYCEFVAVPRYSATGSIMVTNGGIVDTFKDNDYKEDSYENNTLNNTDIQASLNFVYTVTDILNTNGIYKELSEELNGRYTYAQLKSMAHVERKSNNSLFVDISFTATTREEAIELVNSFLVLVPNYINTFVPKSAITSTSTADTAGKVYPNTMLLTAFGCIVGALIVYGIAFLIYLANTVIKGEEDFKDRFDIPVIGCIPDFAVSKTANYYKNYGYGKGGKK